MVVADREKGLDKYSEENTGEALFERLKFYYTIPDPREGDPAQLRKLYSILWWFQEVHGE